MNEMCEWKEYKFGEITEPIKETYCPNSIDDLFYIGLEHIEQETLRLNGIGKSSDVTSNKFKFRSNDILFGKLRPYFRKVVKPNFDGICSTDIWVFRSKEGIDQGFLYYFLANWDFINTANHGEGGTRMPRADWNFLKETKWFLPFFTEQQSIASVLSSLDDKIDLLHRQNTTLEKIAETLFRQWFVEEAKEEWEVKNLDEVTSKITDGTHSTVYDDNEGNYYLLSCKNIKNGEIVITENDRRINQETLIQLRKRTKLSKGDILITTVGTIGEVAMVKTDEIPFELQRSVAIIKPDSKILSVYFLYQFMKSRLFKHEVSSRVEGSVQACLFLGAINKIQIQIPDSYMIEKYHDVVTPYYSQIDTNITQIRTLTTLRDKLLPKLMRGEVRVKM